MSVSLGSSPHVLAALVNLNAGDRYVHWGIIQLSVANLVVIVAMVVVFILAIALPFPHRNRSRQ